MRFRASGPHGDNRIMKIDRDDALRIASTCATTSIDTFCRERNLQPRFIKVDVEGAELDVLRGARETIAAAGASLEPVRGDAPAPLGGVRDVAGGDRTGARTPASPARTARRPARCVVHRRRLPADENDANPDRPRGGGRRRWRRKLSGRAHPGPGRARASARVSPPQPAQRTGTDTARARGHAGGERQRRRAGRAPSIACGRGVRTSAFLTTCGSSTSRSASPPSGR